ncbi:hypothetical protein GUITHDRAFT_119578 [Guillardia theta CCMP2712]|uniref:Uncharacterized protein n=1 Tax=Guillardia theta (strain CCMP2712) TaxID=905079 RepID=L1IEA2_GUITC|nr:hypothetical protein GUITHDRAFT_119578 [Guillardia theta CCMP2712]EKX34229.1 hypothetical protein GUITHDRAFT_119578 [Guillardia theta CCMP2712]|eukprot:XP_005821209.1 hypothetical protein GUITHDRAFT_119578 [Guillardia theta CCMP2712]
MVRPSASPASKTVALAFAQAVSRAVPSLSHFFIPRKGRLSMYDALRDCIPPAVRSHSQVMGEYGVREVEFNKVLEHNGFTKIRDRCILPDKVEATDLSRSGSARYFFSNRRWRNPDDPHELQELRQAWLKLRQLAWMLGADVSLEALEQCCRERYRAWAEITTNWSKAPRRVYRKKRSSKRQAPAATKPADYDDLCSSPHDATPWLPTCSSLSGGSETDKTGGRQAWGAGGEPPEDSDQQELSETVTDLTMIPGESREQHKAQCKRGAWALCLDDDADQQEEQAEKWRLWVASEAWEEDDWSEESLPMVGWETPEEIVGGGEGRGVSVKYARES